MISGCQRYIVEVRDMGMYYLLDLVISVFSNIFHTLYGSVLYLCTGVVAGQARQ